VSMANGAAMPLLQSGTCVPMCHTCHYIASINARISLAVRQVACRESPALHSPSTEPAAMPLITPTKARALHIRAGVLAIAAMGLIVVIAMASVGPRRSVLDYSEIGVNCDG
jgi:hypothetical protein